MAASSVCAARVTNERREAREDFADRPEVSRAPRVKDAAEAPRTAEEDIVVMGGGVGEACARAKGEKIGEM